MIFGITGNITIMELDIYTRLQFVDFNTYLPDDILTKVDRVSMAVSIGMQIFLF